MTSWCCTASRVRFIRAPSQTSFLRDSAQVYKDSCGLTGDPGHIPGAVGACFPTTHTQHCVGKLAAMCIHPPWQSEWIMQLVLTSNFWEAYAEGYEFFHNSHQKNTTMPWNPTGLVEKAQTGLPKNWWWGNPFSSSSLLWAHIPLLRKHNKTQNTSLESLEAAAAQSLAKPSLPYPTWVPSTAISQLWQVLAGLAPAAGSGSNRKNRYGHSTAELCTTGSGFWCRGKVRPQDSSRIWKHWLVLPRFVEVMADFSRENKRKK